MAKLILTPENQIQRLNTIFNSVEQLRDVPLVQLKKRVNPKSWSVLEVILHLNIAYGHYHKKFEEILPNLSSIDVDQKKFKCRAWQKLVIEGQRPKNNVRKWKMKTLKRFEPIIDLEHVNDNKANEIIDSFFALYGHLKETIVTSRGKDVTKIKFASAIGPIVNFYLPESFEFLICPLERHMVQISEILKQVEN